MFRDRAQIARVCAVLTTGCGTHPWFDAGGPTQAARQAQQDPAELSPTERALLELSFCFWEGERGPAFGVLLQLLDPRRLRLLGSLLMALSESRAAVDRWLRANGGPVGEA